MSKKVTFGEAISLGFKKWNVMHDTASLSEFWYWYLFQYAIGFVAQFSLPFASALASNSADAGIAAIGFGIVSLAELVLVVPSISLLVRRFKDAGVNSRLLYLWLICPVLIVGGLVLSLSSLNVGDGGRSFGPGLSAAVFSLFFALIPVTVGLGIFTLVITLRPTKTFEQGNRWAKPSQGAPVAKALQPSDVQQDLPVLGSNE